MKPFSTVRFLSRHEIGMNEKRQVEVWEAKLKSITKVGGGINKALGIGDTRHFEVELRRVNKFLKNLPI